MFNVIKRDGEVAAFQLSKITQAIEKAFQAQEKQYTPDMMEMLGLRVTADFQKKIKKDATGNRDRQISAPAKASIEFSFSVSSARSLSLSL